MSRQSDQFEHGQHDFSPPDDQTALEERIRTEWEPRRQSYDEYNAQTGEFDETFDEFVSDSVRYGIARFQKNRAYEDLEEFSVEWDQISPREAAALREVIDGSTDERPIQDFLRDHPKFLVQALAGGHGRFQIAKPRFGSEYEPDFLVAEAHSFGLDWYLVEVESPKAALFRKDGRPRQAVHHAIDQIRDWRAWLASNRDYARKARADNGLGLVGIDSQARGLIVIGRRSEFPKEFNEFRRSAKAENRIAIHTYDWLLQWAERNTSGTLRFEYPR